MSQPHKPTAGVIGLGIIGERVVVNLRKAGFQVWVWNRSPRAQPNFLPSAKDLADATQHIQIFVSDGPALLEVLDKMSPALTSDHIILSHATISPQETLEAAKKVEKTGAKFLEAAFTGSRDAAEKGELVYYIGGSVDVLESVRPLLSASSKTILHLGEVGHASTVKIATNLIGAASIQALSEAFAVLYRSGVPLQKLVDALEHNAALSPTMSMKFPCMLNGDFEPRFSLKNMFKDVQLALGLASQYGLELPAASSFAGSAISGIQHGWGDLDFSVISRHFGYPPEQPMTATADLPATPPPPPEKKTGKWSLFGSKKK